MLIQGILGILIIFVALAEVEQVLSSYGYYLNNGLLSYVYFLLFIGFVLAIGEIVSGVGMLKLKQWAWWTTIIIEGISILYGLAELFQGSSSSGSALLGLIIPVVIGIYLLADKKVRAAFRT